MDLLFWVFFCLLLAVGLYTLLTNNPVHSILALVLIFFLSSCLTISLGVEFLAILILIVYVGAISVLFLFVVMLLNIRVLELNVSFFKYWWLGVMYSSFFLMILAYTLLPIFADSVNTLEGDNYTDFIYQTTDWNVISQFGELIFLYFPHLLIFAALILFVAIVSPVVLSFVTFSENDSKILALSRRQNIFVQTLRFSIDRFAKH
jgi:NADH-quinone oxidoreductase subunit J